MQALPEFTQTAWFTQLSPDLQQLVELSMFLYQREQKVDSSLTDYAFVVLPMAKAFEGFIKLYLHSLGLIPDRIYHSRKFRVGRALNPDVRPEHRNGEWLYDDVALECGQAVARTLWEAWLICRNQLVHYFPDKDTRISLAQAEQCLLQLADAIDQVTHCQAETRRPSAS